MIKIDLFKHVFFHFVLNASFRTDSGQANNGLILMSWLQEWWLSSISQEKCPPSLQTFCAKQIYFVSSKVNEKPETVGVGQLEAVSKPRPWFNDKEAQWHITTYVSSLDLMKLFNVLQKANKTAKEGSAEVYLPGNQVISQLNLPNALKNYLKITQETPDRFIPHPPTDHEAKIMIKDAHDDNFNRPFRDYQTDLRKTFNKMKWSYCMTNCRACDRAHKASVDNSDDDE